MSAPWIAAFVALWISLLLLAVILLGVLRRITGVLERAEAAISDAGGGIDLGGVAPGSVVSPFELRDADGRTVTSAEVITEPTILVFMSSRCGPCKALSRELGGAGATIDGLAFFVVMDDSDDGRRFTVPPSVPIVYQLDGAVSAIFQQRSTPQAFVIDQGGFVLDRAIPNSLEDLRSLAAKQKGGGLKRNRVEKVPV